MHKIDEQRQSRERQYAPTRATGAAGKAALRDSIAALESTAARLPEAETLLTEYKQRSDIVDKYVDAYR